jgi:hypothetical protein
VLLAASVALAKKSVDVLSETEAVMPGEEKAEAEPVGATAVVQFGPLKIVTVEPASADPMTLGLLLLAGDVGDTDETMGALGAVESST